MDRITGVMMSLLTGQVCGGEPPLPALTADEAAHLYALSKTYDLAHLAGSALLHRSLLPDGPLRAAFEKQVLLAVWACRPPATRRDIGEKLAAKGWAPATVLNFLYRLEKKGCWPSTAARRRAATWPSWMPCSPTGRYRSCP